MNKRIDIVKFIHSLITAVIMGFMFPLSAMCDELPVLNVTTNNNEMPSCNIIEAPEGLYGVSITNNNYVTGRMVMTQENKTLYDSQEYIKGQSGMKIKIRGNSTGAYLNQHPYKIKLTKKSDLLFRNEKQYEHKEWALLSMYTWNIKMSNSQSNILNMAGNLVSKLLNKEWTPEYGLVQLYINNEYQGMYYLMETVERGEGRVNIDKDGFLIEHDTFWWKETIFFTTPHQDTHYAYTYKYPDKDDVNDSINQSVSQTMEQMEETLYSHGDVSTNFDLQSFARWILIHDILGTDDSVGCNRYLCRRNTTSPLQTGPLWDYDSTFRTNQGWSTLHTASWYYYPLLFSQPYFVDTYLNLWKEVKPTLLNDIKQGFDTIWQKYGSSFDDGLALHRTKYPNEGVQSFKSQIDEVVAKLSERITLVDQLMQELETSAIVNNSTQPQQPLIITNLQGITYQSNQLNCLPNGIYILSYPDGNKKIRINHNK